MINKLLVSSGVADTFNQLFRNAEDPLAKSRANIVCGNMTNIIWSVITANVFFVGFLRANGASDTKIGTINMLLLSCGLFQLFSPLILERFLKRKRFVLTMRGVYGFLHLGVISVLPFLPVSSETRLLLIGITFVLAAAILNGFVGSGAAVWHIQSIPGQMRANYFTYNSIASTAVTIVSTVSAGAFLDGMSTQGKEIYAFLALRIVAVILMGLDSYFYSRAVELPYSSAAKSISLKSLMLVPLRHKPFVLMMATMMFWSFLANMSGTYYTMYLLGDLGYSYRLISFAGSFSTAVVLCTTPLWGQIIRKKSWLPTLAIALPLYSVFYASLGFVTAGGTWLYLLCVLGTAFIAPGINLVAMNLPYLHTPEESRTMYISMFTTGNAFAAFAGVSLGNILMIGTQNLNYTILGLPFGNKQSMCILQAALMLLMTLAVRGVSKIASKYQPVS